MKQRKVFFLSDGTAITSEHFGKSVLSQFPDIKFITETMPFINTSDKACAACEHINKSFKETNTLPLVFMTVVSDEIVDILKKCNAINYPLFEYLIKPLEQELQIKSAHKIGKFRSIGKVKHYKNRLDIIDFALKTDDGVNFNHYADAEIILLGASRVGKTPTCLYLAMHYQIRAANYPITDNELNSQKLPSILQPWKDKCFGLTINPMQLSQIREERLPNSHYAEISQCKFEISQVESMYFLNRIPSINTSNTSIEEISSEIINRANLSHQKHKF